MIRLTAPERETSIVMNDDEDIAYVWTCQRTIITKLEKNKSFNKTGFGKYGSTHWIEGTLPKKLISFRSARTTKEKK